MRSRYDDRESEEYFRYGDDDDEGHYYYNGFRERAVSRYGPFSLLFILMTVLLLVAAVFALLTLVAVLAEAAEDYPSRAKSVMWGLIFFSTVMHIAIMAVDRPSLLCSIASLITNALCARLMTTFPFFSSFTSPRILMTIVAMLLENALWLMQLRSYVRSEALTSVEAIVFMLFLWLLPAGFLCAAAPDSELLPGTRTGGGGGGWAKGRAASPTVPKETAFGSGGDRGYAAGTAAAGAAPSPFSQQQQQTQQRRHQSLLGRAVRFFKNPDQI